MLTTFVPGVRDGRGGLLEFRERGSGIAERDMQELMGGWVASAALEPQPCGAAMWAEAHVRVEMRRR